NYAYINPSREWQQTGTGLGKIILAHHSFMKALDAENVTAFPETPTLRDVARFEFFAKGEKQEGVWLYRRGRMQFALPITVGTKPAISDYLPVPFGLAGFAPPVEEVYPALVPFITLADGKTYAAADGADEIVPGKDGTSLKVINRKWAIVGSKPGERFANGLTSHVSWQVTGNRLVRREVLTADDRVMVKNWRVAVPSTASTVRVETSGGEQRFVLDGREGTLAMSVRMPGGFPFEIRAAGDGKLSKGVLGAVPIHLFAEAGERVMGKGESLTWEISFEIVK
nr:hypothetical protein [Blastocatellia bacterium]